jgi:hypothetical protein
MVKDLLEGPTIVVADEAHIIKNNKASVRLAVEPTRCIASCCHLPPSMTTPLPSTHLAVGHHHAAAWPAGGCRGASSRP